MKHILTNSCRWGAILALSMFAVACGPADEENNSTENNQTTNNQTDNKADNHDNHDNHDHNMEPGNTTPGNMMEQGDLGIAGLWASIYGREEITSSFWGAGVVVEFSNTERWVVTQNAADAEYSPSKFNKIVWTELAEDGSFFYCTVDFGLDTLELAKGSEKVADASAPADGGCGDFAWTQLIDNTSLEIVGDYNSNFDAAESFTENEFVSYATSAIIGYNNAQNIMVTQNAEDAEYDPSKFSKIVWTEPADDGSFHYCIAAFGFDTEADAWSSDAVADPSSPDEGGCGDFPWTKLSPKQ